MAAEHIHHVDDGRPPRRVYVNGELVDKAFYADLLRGIVRKYKMLGTTPRERYLIAVKHEVPVITLSGKVRIEINN